jgi:hypothetical protein
MLHRKSIVIGTVAVFLIVVGLLAFALSPARLAHRTREGPAWASSDDYDPLIEAGFAELQQATGISGTGRNGLRVYLNAFSSSADYWLILNARSDGSASGAFLGLGMGDSDHAAAQVGPHRFEMSSSAATEFLHSFDGATENYLGLDLPQGMLFDGVSISFERHRGGEIFSGGGPIMGDLPKKTFDQVSAEVLALLSGHLPEGEAPGPYWEFPTSD